MKPHEEVKRNLVSRWLERAHEDLGLARYLSQEDSPYLIAIGFHAQQAAEKYLKAFLSWVEIEFPKTHSIEHLLNLAASANPDLAHSLTASIKLTEYAVEFRYPGDLPAPVVAQAVEAVTLAEKVHEAILEALRDAGY